MMGAFIDDAIYNYLNSDGATGNDVDIFFNNAGGLRTDWCYSGGVWVNSGCVSGPHAAGLLTYGNMFTILPFGNATVVGQMTGARILEVLNYGPNVSNGVIQPAGLKYTYFSYKDANPGPQPYAWGAFDVTVYNKNTHAWEALDLKKTYNVGTNEFLAPAGGDGFNAFKYMTNISYWGDMLNGVNAYVAAHYGTPDSAYRGPNGSGALDGRIARNGSDSTGSIVPLTILHHNDSHGNLAKGSYAGYTQLATLIKQEKAHNPERTLLLNAGDSIQGDAMMYYFRTAPSGYASDGAPLGKALSVNPLIKAFNNMGYDAMTLGNHEFNFGKNVFKSVLGQADFPLLQANIKDSGAYGLSVANIQPSVTKTVGTEGIKVAIMGIGNHLVPQFELPSNIPGLSFSNPLTRAQTLSNSLRASNDVVIALTHIGFTENPSSVEVDTNVDTSLAASVTGLNAIIGGHSHTNPASGFGNYKYLPTILADPDGRPVVTSQAYRYNNTLGEVVMGLRSRLGGGYDVVSQTGRYLTVATGTVEDAAVKAIVDPYTALLTTYNANDVGATTAPIDTLQAFTQETNGANLQADASVYELETLHGIPVDFHLSGAMTNKLIASGATPASPFNLKISDMFSAMPYENSLVVMHMNGPQIKAILERGYRNYYYYKYVPGYGGYSYYTSCMLDTDASARIIYDDRYPILPSGNNVVSLTVKDTPVDFKDTGAYYNVSTINYLAAGSCNFNDGGATLWPLNQIQQDTQYYVRDAVIDYIRYRGVIKPAIEGRLTFSKFFTISGTLGPAGAGAVVTYTGGSTMADAITGAYSFWAPAGWSGSATPVKTDTVFKPPSRSYLDVNNNQSGQNYAVLPTVTHISPSIGSATGGTTVTISGTGFEGATGVKFGSSVATFSLNTPTRITASSPAGSVGTTVHITVTTPVGTSASSAADQFTYANVAKNVSSGVLYTSLTSALAASVSGNEIRVLNTQLDGDVFLDRTVYLYGGWNSAFLVQEDIPTVLNGNLTVAGGDSMAGQLAVKGALALRLGSLRVNHVAVIPQ
jgi:2',3'-cyclic-nucleotide 2'-phosphodiesterase (5'-nucleotidase family)